MWIDWHDLLNDYGNREQPILVRTRAGSLVLVQDNELIQFTASEWQVGQLAIIISHTLSSGDGNKTRAIFNGKWVEHGPRGSGGGEPHIFHMFRNFKSQSVSQNATVHLQNNLTKSSHWGHMYPGGGWDKLFELINSFPGLPAMRELKNLLLLLSFWYHIFFAFRSSEVSTAQILWRRIGFY